MNSESGSRNQDLVGLPKPPDIYSDDRVLLAWHRTHLANERTFLSWSRTSISLLAFGFVIERFDLFIRQWFRIQGLEDRLIAHHSIVHLALFSFSFGRHFDSSFGIAIHAGQSSHQQRRSHFYDCA